MSVPARQEVVITDIVERVIEGNLSPKTSRQHWRIVEYQLEDVGPGRGVIIGPWRPGRLSIRLGVDGWYRISLISRYADLRLKLSGDRCFKGCPPELEGNRRRGLDDMYREQYYDSEEVFWREADLTDQDLILDDQGRGDNLLAIRLIPIDPPDPETRRVAWPMFFTLDGDDMGKHVHETTDDLFERPEQVPPGSSVQLMVYGGIEGDVCHHHTKVGTEHGALRSTTGDAWDAFNLTVCDNLERWRQWGTNPAVAMVEYAHQRGWEMYFYLRLGGWDSPAQFYGCKKSRFFIDHPEYHIVGPGGEKVMAPSVAYPQVLEHLAGLYSELVSFGAEGVSPCFIRGCPMVLYEPIMVEGFEKQYGKDPRELAPYDPHWQDYRAKMITNYMRRMKEAVGDRKLAPFIHGTQALNRRFALDIATWVREGIVDDLFIMGHQYDRHDGHFAGGPEHLEFDYFQNLPGRQNVRLWPMFYPYGASEPYQKMGYDFTLEKYCAAFQHYMDQGADGYGLWDAAGMDRELDRRSNIFDLGRIPRPYYKEHNRLLGKYELIQWDGYLYNRHSPVEAS